MSDYALWADALALFHAGYVAFVVGGQALILLGWAARWAWARNPWFRWLHVGAIGVVVAEVALGAYCPLTLIEARWRERAGEAGYGETFIGHWVDRLLYYDVPLWQTHVLYVAFAALVVVTLVKYPPRRG